MFQVGDKVVYKRDVCEIKEKKEKYFKDQDYLVLVPLKDKSLKIVIPEQVGKELLRDLISKKEIENIINLIPSINIIEIEEKQLESEYKRLLSNGSPEDYIKIIKTTFLRNKERLDNKKKIGDKDNFYFNQAEEYLYLEIGTVLNMNIEEAKEYITNKVESL